MPSGDEAGVDAASGKRFHLAGGVPHKKDVVVIRSGREIERDRATVEAAGLDAVEKVRKELSETTVTGDWLHGVARADTGAHAAVAGRDYPTEPTRSELVADKDVDEVFSGRLQAALDAQAVHLLGRASESEAAGDARMSTVGADNDACCQGGGVAVGLGVKADVVVHAFDCGQAGA